MKRRILGVAIAAGLLVGGYVVLGPSGQGPVPANPLGAASAQSAEDVDTSGIVEMQLGNPDAPVTVIEYASFTCPHCASFHEGTFKQLKADYIDTGKINFIYREVYFDRFGLWASAIARCGGPERFFGISDLIYAGQSEWTRAGGGEVAAIVEELRKIGRIAGLDSEQIEGCLQDRDKLQALVAWYQENASEDDVTSTPSFIVNGEKHGNLPYLQFKAVIDEAAGS